MELNPHLLAREVALALADEIGRPELPAEVNAALQSDVTDDVRFDGNSMIGLAALVVATAQLAVAIFKDTPGKGRKTQIEVSDELGRRLKIHTGASPDAVEKIVRHTTQALFTDHKR